MPTSLALKSLAFDSTSCCSGRSPEHEMPKLRHYWCWWVQGMRQSFLVGGKRARRPCPCLGAENSLEPAGHTDGHTRSLRISLFTRRLTETILCVGTCDVSSSILRFAIERPLWKIQATTLSNLMVSIMASLLHGLHGFRPGPIDPWSRPRPPRQGPRFVNQIGFPRADPEGNRLFRRRTKLIRNNPFAWKEGTGGY